MSVFRIDQSAISRAGRFSARTRGEIRSSMRRRRGGPWLMFDTSPEVRSSDAATLSWPLFGRWPERDRNERSSKISRHGLAGAPNEFSFSPSGSHGSHAIAECLCAGQPLLRDRPQRATPQRNLLFNRGHDGRHHTMPGLPQSFLGNESPYLCLLTYSANSLIYVI